MAIVHISYENGITTKRSNSLKQVVNSCLQVKLNVTIINSQQSDAKKQQTACYM